MQILKPQEAFQVKTNRLLCGRPRGSPYGDVPVNTFDRVRGRGGAVPHVVKELGALGTSVSQYQGWGVPSDL